MSALTAVEIAAMQADIETLLPDTCVIHSLTLTGDGQGGETEAWAASGTANCRLDNRSGNRANVADSLKPFSGWVLTVPQSTTLSTANRVVHSGETYNVIAVSDLGSWLACKRAALERI